VLYPGRRYIGDTIRLEVNFQNTDGIDVDPEDVILTTRNPIGTETEYVYTDATVFKSASGMYYVEMNPDYSGRWFWRWEASGTGVAKVLEGSFVVQSSPFYDDPVSDYS